MLCNAQNVTELVITEGQLRGNKKTQEIEFCGGLGRACSAV